MGATGESLRLRLALQGSGSFALPGGGEPQPRVEAGFRYDAGDAEIRTGVEVAGGLAYTTGRLSVQVDARTLLVHQDEDYEEWGFSGSVRWQPSERGHGWSMNLDALPQRVRLQTRRTPAEGGSASTASSAPKGALL